MIEGEPSSTSDQPGGQLMLTTEVENFPGWPDGIMGPELMGRFREQALRFGTQIETAKVSRVDLSASPFGVWVGDPTTPEPTYRARSVIVSTGAQSLMLGLPEETRLLGHGLSTCATCDGFFFRDQDIAVVGGGDSALEEATFLTRFARTVTLVHRREELRASKIMQERAFANDKLHFAWAGGVERGQPHYYRVQGKTFLLEYDNVQNEANHVHCVWRSFDGDFGADLLGAHYKAEHQGQPTTN
jgi:thioredoxin reductase (NADPH)